MSRLFTRDQLRSLTLTKLFALHAQLCAELPATAPGSPARITIASALEDVRREIAVRHLARPGF